MRHAVRVRRAACEGRWRPVVATLGVGAGSLSEGVPPLGVGAVPLGADVTTLGVGAGSAREGVSAPGADGSALAAERGDNETKAAMLSAMAET